MHLAATEYLSLGLFPIPLLPKTKQPDYWRIRQTRSGNIFGLLSLKHLSKQPPTEQELPIWFHGECNIGLLTGINGFNVLDFDNLDIYKEWAAQHTLQTPMQHTHRGMHIYIKSNQLIPHALLTWNNKTIGDALGAVRWAVCSPSIHPRGDQYRWQEGFSPRDVPVHEINSLAELGLEIKATHKKKHLIRTAWRIMQKRRLDIFLRRILFRTASLPLLHKLVPRPTELSSLRSMKKNDAEASSVPRRRRPGR